MILLEDENALIQTTLAQKFEAPGLIDQTFTDFDGVAYYLESSKTGPVSLSMDIRCWKQLEAAGAKEVLKREYGQWLLDAPRDGYSVTLEIDYEKVPQDPGESLNVPSGQAVRQTAPGYPVAHMSCSSLYSLNSISCATHPLAFAAEAQCDGGPL